MDTTVDASNTRCFQRLFAQYGMKNNLRQVRFPSFFVQPCFSFALPTGNNEWRNGLGHSFNPLSSSGNISTVIGLTDNNEDYHFDIIFHEMVFDAVKIYEIMPGDTIFISLLQDPVLKFYDAWVKYEDHWAMKEKLKGLSRFEAMSTFLNDTDEYLKDPRKMYLDAQMLKGKGIRKANAKMKHGIEPLIHLVNPQLFVLGFESTEFRQVDNLYQAMIKSTESQFHVMLLDEFFEESLAMLKHKLCWTVRDVVYLAAAIRRPQTVRSYEDVGLSDEIVEKIRHGFSKTSFFW
ncbi:Oidioi.mRNA.OKI2018_I69.XSR.g16767.t1.cds [Oikopleura dioica]|uniref:Oidioi.mRNA.OKI2018_I69.XSR.g16767.t1.cds n=1 Tax=Oikopleura dioica TaxID=34765 RepID=A0ABN7SH67_OIKDI|nr:Oidioi.mRNA.OKI2018_I69.XSR.g16767.t1.cds [Oikopleura dioica]